MKEFSVLIGGKAGFGIDKSGSIIASLLNRLNYRIYILRDYPSLIRGGHTFSLVRACENKTGAHKNEIDFLLALNQDTFNFHKNKLTSNCALIYDPEMVKTEDLGSGVNKIEVGITKIIKEQNASEIMRNTCIIGSFCKAAGIGWDILEQALRMGMPKDIEANLNVARKGHDAAREVIPVGQLKNPPLPLLSGSQAIGLGLIRGGLETYIAYPMTPSSPLLHFLAEVSEEFALKVIHPESEIAVILMALGSSYMGAKTAVGTSGGGFCLMTEGLSFSGMAELPVVIMLGQRPGPSTGLPTYTSQTELHFLLNAGQGEFSRFVASPGDTEEAYFWSAQAMNVAWKYQIPAIILTDKTLNEGVFNFDIESVGDIREEEPLAPDKNTPYKRYLDTDSGVSPLAFVPLANAVIKVNSYEHDQAGITTEEPALTIKMQDKRLRKERYLLEDIEKMESVKIYGDKNSSTALLCWGSNKWVCIEAAERFGLRVVQPLVLWPFPVKQFSRALEGVKRLILVENNATAQLARLIKIFDFSVNDKILKYDGRPFSVDELDRELADILKKG